VTKMIPKIPSLVELWADRRPYTGMLRKRIPLGGDLREALMTLVERWDALYQHYGIDPAEPNAKDRLLLSLARAHVPGLQLSERKKRGRRPISPVKQANLRRDVDALRAQGYTKTHALKLLASRYGLSPAGIRSRHRAATKGKQKAIVDELLHERSL
jgi:hypothetical protein